jgi:hypothetical protein
MAVVVEIGSAEKYNETNNRVSRRVRDLDLDDQAGVATKRRVLLTFGKYLARSAL